jgi:hypothetical protein
MPTSLAKIATRSISSPLFSCAVLATLAGLLLGALGPFGSYLNDGFPMRAAYWIAGMWIGLGIYGAAIFAARKIAPVGAIGAWPVFILSIFVASLPQALITRFIAIRMWPQLTSLGLTWTSWYLQVVTIGLIASVGGMAAFDRIRGSSGTGPVGDIAADSSPFGSEACLTGDVLALQMEDHYVRVHTAAGSRLVHMPLNQAIGVLGAVDGLRTHRSWWVARHAVARIEGTPRSMTLRLSNGIVAPVARSSVAIIRSAGWFEPRP